MDLEDIDIRAQPLNACVYSIKDVFSAKANLIHHVSIIGAESRYRRLRARGVHAKVTFAENHDAGARNRVLAESFPNDDL